MQSVRAKGRSSAAGLLTLTRGINLEHHMRYLFVLPAVAVILLVVLFPLVYSFGISFFRWDLQIPGRQFIGLGNYLTALQDERVWEALLHTLIILVVALTLELVIGMGLALLLVGELPGKRFFVSLLILPAVISPIVVGHTWRMLWDTQYGPINQVLGWMLGQTVNLVWLSNPRTVYPALIITEVWQWTPFMFLILLAGLAAINPEMIEAAQVDGATSWQVFWRVTIPALSPVIMVALLIRGLDIFKLFDIIFALTGGGPGTLTETITYYIYLIGFQHFRVGYTAAIAFLLVILMSVIFTYLLRRISRMM